MKWQEKYQEWRTDPQLDLDMKEQLRMLSDPAMLEDRFYDY